MIKNEDINDDKIIIKKPLINKKVDIETNEDKLKKFINEYCELDTNYYSLSYEFVGAYRMVSWIY